MVMGNVRTGPLTIRLLTVLLMVLPSCSPPAGRGDAAGYSANEGGSALSLEVQTWDFGTLKRGNSARRTVAITNRSSGSLAYSAASSCDCLTVEPRAGILAPGEEAGLTLSFLAEDIKERVTKTIYVQPAAPPGAKPPGKSTNLTITVTGRVIPGEGPHLEAVPAPLLIEKKGSDFVPATLNLVNRGSAELVVKDLRCFGCRASASSVTLGAGESARIEISPVENWTGSRWLEIESNDPVKNNRKIGLVVIE
jgi:hypothetical protein